MSFGITFAREKGHHHKEKQKSLHHVHQDVPNSISKGQLTHYLLMKCDVIYD